MATFQQPPPLDFSPINSALDQINANTWKQAELDQRKAEQAMQQRRLQMAEESHRREMEDKLAQHLSGVIQTFEAEPDPAKRMQNFATLKAAYPEFQPLITRYLPPEQHDDPLAWAKVITGHARGYQDPTKDEAAKIALEQAKLNLSGQRTFRDKYTASGNQTRALTNGGAAAINNGAATPTGQPNSWAPTTTPALNPNQVDALVRLAAAEAKPGSPDQGAVVATAINRSLATGKPVEQVITPDQYEGLKRRWDYTASLTPQHPDYQKTLEAIQPVLSGQVSYPYTHFYAPEAQAQLGRQPPNWAQGPGTQIGPQRFYGPLAPFAPSVAPQAPSAQAPAQPTPSAQSAPPPSQRSAPSAYDAITPQQRAAMQALEHDRQMANDAAALGVKVPEAIDKRVQQAEKDHTYLLPGHGIVRLPGADAAEANKAYATKAPEHLDKLDTELADAYNQREVLRTMQAIAPYAATGFTGPIPPEVALSLRKMAGSFGIGNADTIAATELFKILSQKGVFELTKSLKPASNLDMIASERATASIMSDPATLPYAIPLLLRVEERKIAMREAQRPYLERGMAPPVPQILKKLNEDIPLWGNAKDEQDTAAAPAKAAAASQPPSKDAQQAAPLTAAQLGEAPIGTRKLIGGTLHERAVGPDGRMGWAEVQSAAPAAQPDAAELQRRAQMSPVDRAAENRAAAQRRATAAPAQQAVAADQAARQASAVQTAFDADLKAMAPDLLAIKYGNTLRQLRPDQRQAYQAALNSAVPMTPRR